MDQHNDSLAKTGEKWKLNKPRKKKLDDCLDVIKINIKIHRIVIKWILM